MINSTSHYKAMIDKDFSEYLKNFKCKFKEILKIFKEIIFVLL